jgi:uncharacterized protein (DUF1015 family)
MAVIKPFNGLRFTKRAGELSELVCPPYDIISPEMKKNFSEVNGNNIVKLELPDSYEGAGKTLNEWILNGVLAKDNEPSIYVYEMEFLVENQRKSLKGFVTLVKLAEFSEEVVLPHEETLSKAKTDRFNLMSATFANFSQIYSLYMDDGDVPDLLEKASLDLADMEVTDNDNVVHRMWIVNDKEIISEISKKFSDKKLYIADGHHRYETALNFRNAHPECENAGYVMMFLADMENDGLVVLPTHRIVRGLENYSTESLLKKAKKTFTVKEVNHSKPDIEKSFVLYDGDKYYQLTFKDKLEIDDKSQAYCDLDVTVLHELLLERCLGIDKANMAAQINLTYTKYLDEAISAVDKGEANCCVILNATKVSQIKDVANEGEKMPQKSTYFYPKMLTGLVSNKF